MGENNRGMPTEISDKNGIFNFSPFPWSLLNKLANSGIPKRLSISELHRCNDTSLMGRSLQVYLAWSRENRCCSMWKFAHTPFLPDWICWVMIWVCVEVVDTNWWMAVTVWRNVGLLEAISCVREQVRTRNDRNREEKRSGMN